MVILPVIFEEFSEWKNCQCIFEKLYGHEEIQFFDIHCRFFFSLHFAVGCNNRRRIFHNFYGIQFSRVEVFPADDMHTCSGVHHKLSFLRLYCGWQTPLIGRLKECSFVLFFELIDVFGKSPRVSVGASLLSFSLLLRSVLKFHRAGLRWWGILTCILFSNGPLFLGCLHDAAQLLWIVLDELVPRLLCPSVKSLRIPAARCPAIRNPTVAHLSL